MKILKKLLINCVLLIFLFIQDASAQKIIDRSTNTRPSWLSEAPIGKYYRYFSGMGSSLNTLVEAKEQAISDILNEIIMKNKVVAKSEVKTFQRQSTAEMVSRVSREIKQTGVSTTIEGLQKEEEYWEVVENKTGILYRYWLLMKYLKSEYQKSSLSIMKRKPSYGITPVWKSILIPSWGQFYKGEKKKATWILASELVLTSSCAISYYFGSDYNRQAFKERELENRKFYTDLSDRAYQIGAICGITAGMIYFYNIFDAIIAKGIKKYASNRLKKVKFFAITYNQQFVINMGITI